MSTASGPGPSRSVAGFEVVQKCLRRWRAPQMRGDVPVACNPLVVDLVDVGEPFDPGTPGVRVVVEEVRADGVTAQAPSRLAPPGAHPVGAERDRVDGRHLEAAVMEAAVAAGDEPEDVVIAGPGV